MDLSSLSLSLAISPCLTHNKLSKERGHWWVFSHSFQKKNAVSIIKTNRDDAYLSSSIISLSAYWHFPELVFSRSDSHIVILHPNQWKAVSQIGLLSTSDRSCTLIHWIGQLTRQQIQSKASSSSDRSHQRAAPVRVHSDIPHRSIRSTGSIGLLPPQVSFGKRVTWWRSAFIPSYLHQK